MLSNRGKDIGSKDNWALPQFDEKPVKVIHKNNDADLIQGSFFTESSKYHMHLPTHIHTTDVDENDFISVMEGYYLIQHLKKKSPFYELVNQNLESFYIVEVKFK